MKIFNILDNLKNGDCTTSITIADVKFLKFVIILQNRLQDIIWQPGAVTKTKNSEIGSIFRHDAEFDGIQRTLVRFGLNIYFPVDNKKILQQHPHLHACVK